MDRIEELQAQNPDWEHTGGGPLKENAFKTPGGNKESRRPDIEFTRPDGSKYHENVGLRECTGEPIKREKEALDDLEAQLGTRPHFTPLC